MEKLAGERKYTLGFAFSEVWPVAREVTEEEYEIPSMLQFKEALSNCLQWSLDEYLSALSFISFLTIKRRQARYLKLRPRKIRVKDDPRAWWTYAINDVLLDVRERLAHVYWEALEETRRRRDRYNCLVLQHSHTFAASLVSPDVRLLSEEVTR
ncbi:hypothetical protein PsorP6_015607 [Peronosclerospora sorghi]|uniref:Uncharacterized protein n=1 Tax=Peronosclerospora sorghi TaxID=230839 RepID=A0ACC0WME7_9STRA|nr:hypothetical protein PsorP6_015607 [Peronosclerospora sorghi]